MFLYMCMCMHVCMCTYVCMRYTHICIHTHTHTHIYTHAQRESLTPKTLCPPPLPEGAAASSPYVHVCMWVCLDIHIYICYICIHVYIHIHTDRDSYTQDSVPNTSAGGFCSLLTVCTRVYVGVSQYPYLRMSYMYTRIHTHTHRQRFSRPGLCAQHLYRRASQPPHSMYTCVCERLYKYTYVGLSYIYIHTHIHTHAER